MAFHNYLSLTSTLTLSVLLTACNSDLKIEFDEKTRYEKAHGIWELRGYGEIYQLTDINTKVYEYNNHRCILTDVLTIKEAEIELTKNFIINKNGRSAAFTTSQAGAFPITYHRRDTLPETCEEDKLLETSDPEIVFEHLWHTFNDYYAFFGLREVDWQVQYEIYRPLVTSDTTDEQLFTLMSAMLAPLEDGHIQLTAGDKFFSAEPDSQLEIDLYEVFTQQSDLDNFSQFADGMLGLISDTTLSNVSNITQAGGDDNNTILWGTLSGNLGYIQIASMINIVTDGDIENSVKDAEAANTILSQALEDLKDTDGVVIDIRLNSGGHDTVGLAIASHFFSSDQNVLSKFVENNWGTTPSVEAYFTPKTPNYDRPVAVITSDMTVSAAEIFLMSIRARPSQTLIVGSNSGGDLSDVLDKSLPNGWEFSLSNEIYQDYLGVNYETTGIPTDVSVPAFSLEGFANGRDLALEAAIEAITK